MDFNEIERIMDVTESTLIMTKGGLTVVVIKKWRMYIKKQVDLEEFEKLLKNYGWLVDGNIVFDYGYRKQYFFEEMYKDKFTNFNKMVKGGVKSE